MDHPFSAKGMDGKLRLMLFTGICSCSVKASSASMTTTETLADGTAITATPQLAGHEVHQCPLYSPVFVCSVRNEVFFTTLKMQVISPFSSNQLTVQ